jgi:hypothetical protein
MTTYLDMITRIGDESQRADMIDQIKLCVQTSLK